MTHLRVDRNPVRQLLLGLVGVLLIVAALDIVWWHILSTPPDGFESGALTSRGFIDRRQDILWGSVFLVNGLGILGVALIGLVTRLPVLRLTDEGIEMRVLGPRRYMTVPWWDVTAVASGTDRDGNNVVDPVLVVAVADPGRYPPDLWGAEWMGNELRIDAASWAIPVEEVTIHANLLRERLARSHEDRMIEDADSEEPGDDDAADDELLPTDPGGSEL